MLVLKRKLAACLVHRGHAHLSLLETDEALACAEEARTLGATDPRDLSSLLDDADAESEEDLPQLATSPRLPCTSASSFARFTRNIHEKVTKAE
jgi:hypothetical protein